MWANNFQLANELFQRAVDLDRNYGQAYAGLGDSAATLMGEADMDQDVFDAALKDCNRALDINPTLAEGYAARGHVYLYAQLGEIDKSLAALERCLILGRSDSWIQFMKVSDHDLAPVRKDPRFGELVAWFEH